MEKFSRWPEEKRPSRSKRKPKQKRQPRIAKLAHNLLNQLSVIQLSCFSLRQRLQKNPGFNLRDFETIEKAILEAAELTNTLCAKLQDLPGEDNDQGGNAATPLAIGKGNVYAFPPAQSKRK